ncbi:TRAP-type mannitol/chloroaromatic compound transport system permease large subunit [Kutzneria viridogrisea]|uniref:TRAP-type mannitol/chloroaromatic compound transport system permease large subunit n=1 Tax=Kutzneria viridogrisea TaxID=47990 RepID=A0ABR6BXS7_9PSEU|nr:TRAP-type mannitol/chloroaromatic compound transport system permease large subunit [Kutzneria viridogrisea]
MVEVTGRKRRRLPVAYVPFTLVLLTVVIGAQRMLAYHWRQGAVLVGGALLLAAVLRAVLTEDRLALIAIRSKRTDVVIYGLLGLAVTVVAFSIVGGPFDPNN